MDRHRGWGHIVLNMAVSLHPICCQTHTLAQLGSLSLLKGERETESTHISKQAQILDTVLASVFLTSQFADIHILAKTEGQLCISLL